MGIVAFHKNSRIPYAVIEDIVIHKNKRREGLGKLVIDLLNRELKAQKIKLIFIECGKNNTRARKFFQKMKYKETSVIMMKEIE